MHFGTSPSHFPDLVQVSVSLPSRINPSSQKIVASTVTPSSTLSGDTWPCFTCSFVHGIRDDGIDGCGSPQFFMLSWSEKVDKHFFSHLAWLWPNTVLQTTIMADYASFVKKSMIHALLCTSQHSSCSKWSVSNSWYKLCALIVRIRWWTSIITAQVNKTMWQKFIPSKLLMYSTIKKSYVAPQVRLCTLLTTITNHHNMDYLLTATAIAATTIANTNNHWNGWYLFKLPAMEEENRFLQ